MDYTEAPPTVTEAVSRGVLPAPRWTVFSSPQSGDREAEEGRNGLAGYEAMAGRHARAVPKAADG